MLALAHQAVIYSSSMAACAAEAACASIVTMHRALKGPWPTEDQETIDTQMIVIQDNLDLLALTRAETIQDLQAKGRALRLCPDHPELIQSILDDIESLDA